MRPAEEWSSEPWPVWSSWSRRRYSWRSVPSCPRRASRAEDAAYVETFSPQLRSFLSAPAELALGRCDPPRAGSTAGSRRDVLFPGFAIGILALSVSSDRCSHHGCASVSAPGSSCVRSSLGVRDVDGPGGTSPVRLLFDFAPAGTASAPGSHQHADVARLALLAGRACACSSARSAPARRGSRLRQACCRRRDPRRVSVRSPIHACLRRRLRYASRQPAAQPAGRLQGRPPLQLLDHGGFPRDGERCGGFDPDGYDALGGRFGLPDARSVRVLRELGVRSVLLHRRAQASNVAPTPTATVPTRSVAITRRRAYSCRTR